MVGELFGTKGLFLPQSMQWEIIRRDIWKTMKRKLLPVSVEKLKNIHQMNWGLISSFKEEKTKIQSHLFALSALEGPLPLVLVLPHVVHQVALCNELLLANVTRVRLLTVVLHPGNKSCKYLPG